MSSPLSADLFVEDRAHEAFVRALLERLAREARRGITIRVRSARGGHGRVLSELGLYRKAVERRIGGMTVPDLLVVAIDANCQRLGPARKAIARALAGASSQAAVIACPDPHVERWYLADPDSLVQVVGSRPRVPRGKCDRDYYKQLLARSVEGGGSVSTLGGIEYAVEIVAAMDLYRARRRERSLRLFLDEVEAALRCL
jgi:hypothetical protein